MLVWGWVGGELGGLGMRYKNKAVLMCAAAGVLPSSLHCFQPLVCAIKYSYTVKKARSECAKFRCWQRWRRTKRRESRNFPTPTSFGSRHRCPHRNFPKLFLQCTDKKWLYSWMYIFPGFLHSWRSGGFRLPVYSCCLNIPVFPASTLYSLRLYNSWVIE